jgi:4-hydroxyacetophenone monooxygenase
MTQVPTQGERLDVARLRSAVEAGNVPTLLAVLLHLTHDQCWLEDRFRPTRSRGMDDNRTGGLPETVQAEIRDAVVVAVEAWHAAGAAAPAPLSTDELTTLMDFTTGEHVPPEFAPMMHEIVHGATQDVPVVGASYAGMSAVVIGAGIAGMLASTRLTAAGVEHVVLEKNAEVGGSWWENRYPGAGVDTPSYLYSLSSFEHDWSTHFGKRDEVQGYLEAFADQHDIRRRVRFGVEVTRAAYDAEAQQWTVSTRDDRGATQELTARILISAVGLLNRPKVPALPGLDSFEGPLFHSARWPAELDEPGSLRGKRVAIVGAGASAMQIGPAIVDRVGSLTVFQRSPQWIAPNEDYFAAVDADVHWLMAHVPGYRGWYRARLSWIFNDKVHSSLQIDPDWPEEKASINATNHGHRQFYERYLRDRLDGRPDLVEKSLPDYPPFGKRMLLDNGWYDMLRRPQVDLVTEGVAAVTPTGLVDTAGVEHAFDVVVLATGFQSDRFLHPMEVVGRSGRSTREVWGEHDARAYLGMTVPDFPNLFVMTGPNTALGHGGSFITILECQIRYIMHALATMAEQGLGVLECRPEVSERYNDAVDEAHSRMVWTHPAMDNWYRNDAGRVVAVLPWRIIDYWTLTRGVDLADYTTEPVDGDRG